MNNDCIYNIFIKLNVNDIINCALVCKRFYNIGKTEMLWYLLFKEKFYNVKCTNENNKKFYDNYKKYSILNNFMLKNNQDSVNIIIRVLNVSYKQLQTVSKEFGQLASLQELYLPNNQLQTIPKNLVNWQAYKHLICIITNYRPYQKNLVNWLAYKNLICLITNYIPYQKNLVNWLAYKYLICLITNYIPYQKNLVNWLAYKDFICIITNYIPYQKNLVN